MNTQLFNMYKDSERGKEMIALFEPESEKTDIELAEGIFNIQKKHDNQTDIESLLDIFLCFSINIENTDFNFAEDDSDLTMFQKLIDNFELKYVEISEDGEYVIYDNLILKKTDFRSKNAMLGVISTYLYLHYDFHKPLLLNRKFPFIQHACDKLGIELPPIPRIKDYRQYLYYYFDICTAFNQFQKENNLTDAEFCAALYDFFTILDEEK